MSSLKNYDKPSFSIISLGCSKNLVDSEVMLSGLLEEGYSQVDVLQNPDITIINTCGFIQDAKEESIQCILEASQKKADSLLIVAGCLSELYGKKLKQEIPEIDILAGTNEYPEISGIIQEYKRTGRNYFISGSRNALLKKHNRTAFEPKPAHRYVKIAEGCSRKCSFCVIPAIKGKHRSKPQDLIISEISELIGEQVFEFNLISQDTMQYGKDFGSSFFIEDLVRKINSIKGDFYCRLLYLNPSDITESFIKTIRDSEKFINYFDIPIQHLSDKVLKAMNRPHSSKDIMEKIDLIRNLIPGATLRTTVITGFPGETCKDFNQLISGIKEVEFDRLGCFTYSDEEFAPSSRLKSKVSRRISCSRLNRVMEIQQEIHYKRIKKQIGQVHKGIISPDGDRLLVQAPEIDGDLILENMDNSKKPGIYDVLVTGVTEYDFIGIANEK